MDTETGRAICNRGYFTEDPLVFSDSRPANQKKNTIEISDTNAIIKVTPGDKRQKPKRLTNEVRMIASPDSHWRFVSTPRDILVMTFFPSFAPADETLCAVFKNWLSDAPYT